MLNQQLKAVLRVSCLPHVSTPEAALSVPQIQPACWYCAPYKFTYY